MKSKLIEQKSNQGKYPRLFKNLNSNMTILFTAPRKGIVVVGCGDTIVGDSCDAWTRHDDKSQWHELPKGSKVILEQE